MKHVMGVVLAAGAALLTGSSYAAEQKIPKQVQQLLAITPEQAANAVAVTDDSLETIAKLSTENVFREKRGLLGIVWNDNFLRAFVDKGTGTVSYQVYQYISYSGDWRFYNQVNYEAEGGPMSLPVTEIARKVETCAGSRYGGCTLGEHVAFDVPEALLRTIASRYQPNTAAVWRFKFKAKAYSDWQDGMAPAEVAGLLIAVDRYKERIGK